MPVPRRPDPEPRETDEVAVVAAGTVAFALALLLGLAFHARLHHDGHDWWLATAACGVVLGLAGLRYCRRRRRAISRDRARS